jgi:hypothetical protein
MAFSSESETEDIRRNRLISEAAGESFQVPCHEREDASDCGSWAVAGAGQDHVKFPAELLQGDD